MVSAWKQWEKNVENWVKIQEISGGDKVQHTYNELLAGKSVLPHVGYIASLFSSKTNTAKL